MITNGCSIEEVEVKSLSIRALKYNFVPLAHLVKHTNSREGIGVKIQTRGSTTFIFDPALPKANAFKTWCMAHSTTLKKMPSIELHQLGLVKSFRPHQSEIITVNRLPMIVSMMEIPNTTERFHRIHHCYSIWGTS